MSSGLVLIIVLLTIFVLALLVGIIGNIAGIGGGIIMVIFLIYMFGFNPIDAAGLSLLTIVFSTLSGFIQDIRKRLVDIRLLKIMASVAVVGSVVGSIITYYISPNTFKGIFSIITICIGLFSIYSSRRQTRGGIEKYTTGSYYSTDTGVVSLIAGVVSGFIGIGIGGITGTYLTAIKRSTPKTAFATIIAAMLPVSITGTVIHFYFTGFINISYAPSLVSGALLGGLLGSWIISRAPQARLRFFQGYIIISFGTLSSILYILSIFSH